VDHGDTAEDRRQRRPRATRRPCNWRRGRAPPAVPEADSDRVAPSATWLVLAGSARGAGSSVRRARRCYRSDLSSQRNQVVDDAVEVCPDVPAPQTPVLAAAELSKPGWEIAFCRHVGVVSKDWDNWDTDGERFDQFARSPVRRRSNLEPPSRSSRGEPCRADKGKDCSGTPYAMDQLLDDARAQQRCRAMQHRIAACRPGSGESVP
jgi:hypothetical protein